MQISATRHSLGVSTTRATGLRFSSAGADLNRDTSTGGVAGGSISSASGVAAPMLSVPAMSTGGTAASASSGAGSRAGVTAASGAAGGSISQGSDTAAPTLLM